MGVRREYTVSDARIPEFTSRFRKKVDELGGVTKISELSGISRPTLNFWYNGQRTPDAVSLITLARCFKVSSDWLLGLAEEDNFSNDEKEKLISEYTGLSTKAVQQAHQYISLYSDDSDYYMKTISKLLEGGLNGMMLLDAMAEFLKVSPGNTYKLITNTPGGVQIIESKYDASYLLLKTIEEKLKDIRDGKSVFKEGK